MKYQVSFRTKTWYLHMWKYHCCYSYIINGAFHTKKLLKWNGLVLIFIVVFIINRTLHGCLEIRNFSSSVEKYFTSERSTRKEKFRIFARPCNILYVILCITIWKLSLKCFSSFFRMNLVILCKSGTLRGWMLCRGPLTRCFIHYLRRNLSSNF